MLIWLLAAPALPAQCPDGSAPPCGRQRALAATPSNSVAVLYFENLSRDTADAYIADGFTEEITARLGQVGRLLVTSRAAARRFRNAGLLSTADLGRALNAAYLVNGSVRHGGSQLRVTVELVRATNGARIWGEQYDRTAADLLEIEGDVAQAVATGIAGRLLPGERATLAARPTRNPAAYDLYLHGNRLMWRMSREASVLGAIADYEAALRLDPGFTAARGRLAYAYGLALNWAYQPLGVPAESLLVRGSAAADQALRADSTVSDAWLGRALVLFFSSRAEDLKEGIEAARRAVDLSAGDDAAHQWYGTVLRRVGRFAEAERELQHAALINPSNVQAVSDMGHLAYSERRYAEALSWFDKAFALDTTGSNTLQIRAYARFAQRDVSGALDDARKGLALATPGERARACAVLAEMEARAGQTDSARARLAGALGNLGWHNVTSTEALSVRNAFSPALAAVALGDLDLAIAILEHAQPRGPWLWSYLIFPGFDSLRTDPRFIKIYDESQPPGAPAVPR